MPFKSEKQRKYLWANEPGIARDWTDKYGSRVKKQSGGGIMDQIPFMTGFKLPDVWNQWQQHKLATNLMKEDPNTRDYHQMGGHDFMQRFPNTPDWLGKGLATGYQLASEFGKGILDPSRMSSFLPRALEEARLNRLGIEGLTPDQQARYDSFSKTFDPTIESMYPTDRLSGIGNAFKNEFGGSAEAATLGNLIRPRSQASQAPQIRDRWNIKYGTDETLAKYGDQGWVGGPLKEYDPKLDLNKAYRLGMNEYLKRNKPISYSETDIIPSEHPYANMIKTIPYKGSRFSIKDIKNIGLNQDEDDPYLNRIRNRINTVSQPRGIMASLRNRFYKPATSAAGGYNVSQLNQMNALGGYYSEPARAQRRNQARVNNMMARKAAGKSYSKTNLANLSDQSSGGGWQPDYSGAVAHQQQEAKDMGISHEQLMSDLDSVYAKGGRIGYQEGNRVGGLASLWPR